MQSKILNKLAEKHQSIIIFGLGREGLSTYHFLHSKLANNNFVLMDDKSFDDLDLSWKKIIKNHSKTQFVASIKEIPVKILKKSLLLKTPGIPISHPVIKQILDTGTKLTSNTQLFFDLVKEHNANRPKDHALIIGVTGTKGKSTTSSLIYHVLKENKLNAYLGGNIGKPAMEIWVKWQKSKQQSPGFFVLEMSSHQLAELKSSPEIAVVQDIVAEHLDYYENFTEYYQAKTQIARFQTKQDLVIFNQDSKTATQLAKLSKGKQLSFSLTDKKLVELAKSTQLLGTHNLYNVMPAIIIAQHLGVSTEKITQAVKSFKSLPHRLEFVAKVNGVDYYNDSIATVPEATIAALETFADRPIVLIAGGYERRQKYRELAEKIIKSNVKALSLLPPTGQRLLAEINALNPCNALRASIEEFTSMAEAVYFAFQKAEAGYVVLLSPGAASFSTFRDYVDRGNQFKKAVKKLKA